MASFVYCAFTKQSHMVINILTKSWVVALVVANHAIFLKDSTLIPVSVITNYFFRAPEKEHVDSGTSPEPPNNNRTVRHRSVYESNV